MLRMLQNKKLQKKVLMTILIFILPGFLIWGFSSSVKNTRQQNMSLGKIFNRNISEEDYLEAIRAVEIQLQLQLGENYYQLQKLFDLKNMALQRLVMLYEADKRKIRVSDAELAEYIQKNPSFYRKGTFDNNLYEQEIKYSLRMQPRAFEEMTRKNLKIGKLVKNVTQELKLNDPQIREAYKKENEQMSVYYIAAIPADFNQNITPSETEVKEYFDKNSIQFKKPLSYNLEFLQLNSTDTVKLIKKQIENKESLEKIAQENNFSIQETGLFGEVDPIPGIGWSKEISKSLSQLKPSELLGPLEIENKFYLFRLKTKREPFIPEFKDILEEITTSLVKTKSREMAKVKIEECSQKIKNLPSSLAQDTDFDKIAKELNLKSATTGLFKFGSYIESIGASDNFFNAAVKLKDNAASPIIELPSGFYIIKLKDKPDFDEKKFSEDKIKFSEKLLEEKKQEFFDKFLKELLAKSQGA